MIYDLSRTERQLNFPFPLVMLGWMPHHRYRHREHVLNNLFFCFSFNKEKAGLAEVNGERHQGTLDSTFGMLLPGTRMNTVRDSVHDELFFAYDAECTKKFQQIFGVKSFHFQNVYPSGFLQETVGEIRKNLNVLHEPGAADHLDQLAFSFITGLYTEQRTCREQTSDCDLRIPAAAAELTEGKLLIELLKKYGFSRRSFFREWHRFSPELTPAQYRLEHQFVHAETLLQQTDMRISEIVVRCGFSSNAYFCKRFRLRHGCSATEYRKRKSSPLPDFQRNAP